jgi:hypothetical protein
MNRCASSAHRMSRLQPVVEALLNGRLILVQAEKLLGNLVLDEPWVNAIQVREHSFRCPV